MMAMVGERTGKRNGSVLVVDLLTPPPFIIATRTLSKTVMIQVTSLGRHGKLSPAAAKTVSVARFATATKQCKGLVTLTLD